MRIEADWLSAPATQAVMSCLTGGGHEAWAVGGCVRNTLLGAPVADVDIATDAAPPRVTELAEAAGFKVVPTGIDHGTATVVASGTPFEVTTFRRDIDTDGRRATVAFAASLEEDASRRDFTMNAVYVDATGTVRDPTGGLEDLRTRTLRFIGDAEARIREDYLRILRFFRFYAWYGDPAAGPDPEALDAVARLQDGLDRLSAERVGAELVKLFAAPDPSPAAALMERTGILTRLMPGTSTDALAPLVHLELGAVVPPDFHRRMAVLGDIDAAALRFSNAARRRIEEIRAAATDSASPRTMGYRLGYAIARDALLVRYALRSQFLPVNALEPVEIAAQKVFPLRGSDLPDQLKGAEIGRTLRRLEDAWIESDFTLDRQALLDLV